MEQILKEIIGFIKSGDFVNEENCQMLCKNCNRRKSGK
ncbi:MAG: HNH endonuclease [Candidatus Marinimicrobia bacterium]|nr:HNH endonuclease [Candidatus Neomarinimicrobiota bacterium]